MSILYIVATPIGNLSDISQRALETLKQVDYILCEDTRLSQKMFFHFNIKKPLIAYHQHSCLAKIDYILGLLQSGKNLALISDAGTPGISDPGGKLVQEVIKSLSGQVKIVPIPGASAITAIASVCGFPMDRFLFLGFPPQKKKRKQFFEEIANAKYPVIFYESPYRIIKTFNDLRFMIQDSGIKDKMRVVAGRELTKKFETIYRGTIETVIQAIEKDKIKGEFTVVVGRLK